jgi:xanthine dehydrogenase small subunit
VFSFLSVTLEKPPVAALIQFILNNKTIHTSKPAGMVLLDFIRYQQHLTGTKTGCNEGDCGACTVLVGGLINNELQYRSFTSCLTPLGNVHGKHIVTIEGLNMERLNPIQQAMCDESATQCGFCTPGFVVSLAGFCLSNHAATTQQAIAAIDGNICRCTGYKSIERAATKIAGLLQERNGEDPAQFVARKQLLPSWFAGIKERLYHLNTAVNGHFTEEQGTFHFVGGGTDVYVQKPEEMQQSALRFLFGQPVLKDITVTGNRCSIGPSATVTDLMQSAVIQEYFPGFAKYAKLVSSTPIRNMATIGGNFINASPIGDFTIFFLALNATLVLNNGTGSRELPLRQLYKGYKTLAKTPEEYIERIWFELPFGAAGANSLFNFEKVSKRTHLDIASVNTAILLTMNSGVIKDASVAAGGVAPVPKFLEKTSAFLRGQPVTPDVVNRAIAMAQTEIAPISDARGTAEYKRLLLGQLMKAHFITLFPVHEKH